MKQASSFGFGLGVAGLSALVFVGYGLLETFGHRVGNGEWVRWLASFASFGFLVGGILAFDVLPGERGTGRPVLRTMFGLISGVALACTWPWPIEGRLLCVLVGASLGYFGMHWAKYL